MSDIFILGVCAFLAGFMDAVVGGGGLIQLPALLLTYPSAALPVIFGTNKLTSLIGTAVAVPLYARRVRLDWRVLTPATLIAAVFAYAGAHTMSLFPSTLLRPLVLVLLVIVAVYTFLKKDLGMGQGASVSLRRQQWMGGLMGAGLGFYDGFFGPGTGSFLLFIFVGAFNYNFLEASASAKVINLGTNLAAVIYFASHDQILYAVAAPLAVCNALGSYFGSRLAIQKGSRFIRLFFLLAASALIARFGYSTIRQIMP